MSEDETPLTTIIWNRVKKLAGDPPSVTTDEMKTLHDIWRQRSTVIRALLITLAVVLLARLGQAEMSYVSGKLKPISAWVGTHVVGLWAFILIIAAIFVQWIAALLLWFWNWNRRRCFVPVVAWFAVGWLFQITSKPLISEDHFCVGAVILFASTAWLLRRQFDVPLQAVDRLQRRYYVERLADLLLVPNATLRRIAVMGSWGEGKTTVLNLLREKLATVPNANFKVAMVNPWKAKKPEQAWEMLANGFEVALGIPIPFHNHWAKFQFFQWITGLKLVNGLSRDFLKLFEGDSPDAEAILINSIKQRLEFEKATVVILVDDMERAEPEVVRKMFPVLDRLRDIEHCFFVFAIDADRVARAFKEEGRHDVETKGYLAKVFDLQIELPEPRSKDIAEMCKALINPKETPKLAAAFDQISGLLPTNPRDALHFLNDAKTKEILFLNRYGPAEHRYADFFLVRILELSAHGIADCLAGQEAKDAQSRAHTAHLMGAARSGGTTVQQHFDSAWDAAKKGHKLDSDEEMRLKAAYLRVLGGGLDIPWALDHHMRLLTPSAAERALLYEYWLKNAGRMSLKHMLAKALPDMNFSDQEASAEQLIVGEIYLFDTTRQRAANLTTPEMVFSAKRATSIAERLRRHFEYSSTNGLDFDLNLFKSDMFEQWLEIMCRDVLSNLPADIRTPLVEEERSFHLFLLHRLSPGARYQFSRSSVEGMMLLRDLRSGAKECLDHLENLRATSLQMVRDDIFMRLKEGTIKSLAFTEDYLVQSLLNVFSDSFNWLPASEEDGLEQLRKLADQACSSESLARSFADVCSSLLNGIGRAIDGGQVDRADLLLQKVQSEPQYFAILWTGALTDQTRRGELLELRAKLARRWNELRRTDLATLDSAFPMPQQTDVVSTGETRVH